MSARRRFFLAQQACAELYPPVLHQASLLGDLAHVTLLDAVTPKEDTRIQTDNAITRVRVFKSVISERTFLPDLWSRAKWRREYRRAFQAELQKTNDVIIAYDPDAINLLLRKKWNGTGAKRIAHLHEIVQDDRSAPTSARLRLELTRRRLARADVVVLPDEDRAKALMSSVKLKVNPLVVMNCPRYLKTIPQSALLPLVKERGLSTDKVVHYQGSVGPDHSLETLIKSMCLWPAEAVFVIIGRGSEQYVRSLSELAATMGVAKRVIFGGRVPYDQVLSYAAGASVGVTMLDPAVPNWKISAGASNKRFEYAALGIPQVTNEGPGIQELFVRPKIAITADHQDPVDLGTKISSYLKNMDWASEVGSNARKMHLGHYNYEVQFQKVLDVIG